MYVLSHADLDVELRKAKPRGDELICSIRCASRCSDERVQQFPSVPDGKRPKTERALCRRSVMSVMQIHGQFTFDVLFQTLLTCPVVHVLKLCRHGE